LALAMFGMNITHAIYQNIEPFVKSLGDRVIALFGGSK
jgi:hypothetical protein